MAYLHRLVFGYDYHEGPEDLLEQLDSTFRERSQDKGYRILYHESKPVWIIGRNFSRKIISDEEFDVNG